MHVVTTAAVTALLVAGCASPRNKAPVEERASRTSAPAVAGTSVPIADPAKPLPGAENGGKTGYYTIKPGDTLIRIGLETGQNWRDIARWNNIDNPNVIEVGQVVRVLPPGIDPNVAATKPVVNAKVETKPLDPRATPTQAGASAPVAAAPVAAMPAGSAPAAPTASAPAAPVVAAASPAAPHDADDDLNWIWPANGPVATAFDESRTKGVAITGKAGDPVLAAADGRVVYAGSGLRGYGNLVIVKHNATYLTAYAHNQTLLVKEDQVVRRGQKIAEMGSSDAERVQLHFEIRKQGKPVDPARLLPPR
jgi:lipoprotein NlpD